MDYDDFEPNRLKHLELIQAIVGRLAGNSFLVKGWAITVSGAFFGFALNLHSTRLAIVGAVPILAFWALDMYFLRSERLFRALYDEVRLKDARIEAFFMGAVGSKFVRRVRNGETACDNRKAASWARAAASLTVLPIYLGLMAVTAVIAGITHSDDTPAGSQPMSLAVALLAYPIGDPLQERFILVSRSARPDCAEPISAPPGNDVQVKVEHGLFGG